MFCSFSCCDELVLSNGNTCCD
uniref:Uncharacterized protein n=1 Tax=Rhizophora mucronata TaxID=61149 RepID=A0A2P2MKX5_RHIMU